VLDPFHKGCYPEANQNMFFLGVAHSEVPIRVIDITRVLTVNGSPVVQEKKQEKKLFKVTGSKGDIYTVTVINGVPTSCECVANSNFRKFCRHMTEVKEKINEQAPVQGH
jgi:hypothetical protein